MALGVCLGSAIGDAHGVTERVCDAHRSLWLMAMMSAAVLVLCENTEECEA
jgi:hypothetical protein